MAASSKRWAAAGISLVAMALLSSGAMAVTILNSLGSGGIGFIVDGTSNTFQFTETSNLAVCADRVGLTASAGGIVDGTSNTLAFSETQALYLQAGLVRPRQPIGGLLDGTSNTIFVGETVPDAVCLGEARLIAPITDGSSNTIQIGEDSRLDVCLKNVRQGSVTDGLSNTIVFGKTLAGPICFEDVQVDLTAPVQSSAVPAPPPAMLLISGLLAMAAFACARSRTAPAVGTATDAG